MDFSLSRIIDERREKKDKLVQFGGCVPCRQVYDFTSPLQASGSERARRGFVYKLRQTVKWWKTALLKHLLQENHQIVVRGPAFVLVLWRFALYCVFTYNTVRHGWFVQEGLFITRSLKDIYNLKMAPGRSASDRSSVNPCLKYFIFLFNFVFLVSSSSCIREYVLYCTHSRIYLFPLLQKWK